MTTLVAPCRRRVATLDQMSLRSWMLDAGFWSLPRRRRPFFLHLVLFSCVCALISNIRGREHLPPVSSHSFVKSVEALVLYGNNLMFNILIKNTENWNFSFTFSSSSLPPSHHPRLLVPSPAPCPLPPRRSSPARPLPSPSPPLPPSFLLFLISPSVSSWQGH